MQIVKVALEWLADAQRAGAAAYSDELSYLYFELDAR